MTPPVLAAEDEESDAMILRLAFRRVGLANPLVVVPDGQEAVDYLAGRGQFSDRVKFPLPRLVLLDLKMPRLSGLDVLAWLRAQPNLRDMPAVVLSSSPDQSDIERAKASGAQEYYVKPHSLRELVAIVEAMKARWLDNGHASGTS